MRNDRQSVLKFNLDTQEGRDSFMRACKADKAYRALHEIDAALRLYTKYEKSIKLGDKIATSSGEHVITENESLLLYEFISNIRDELSDIVTESGIEMDEEYR